MKLIFKIGLSLVLGFFVTLYLVQRDIRFKSAIHEKLKNIFEEMFECNAEYTLKKFDVLRGCLHAQDVVVTGSNGGWSWLAKDFKVELSWLSLLKRAKLGLNIMLNDIQADSLIIDGKPAISDHFKMLVMEANDMPLAMNNLSIQKVLLTIHDEAQTIKSFLAFSAEMRMALDSLKLSVFITDAAATLWQVPCIKSTQARLLFEKSETGSRSSINGKIILDQMGQDQQDCYLSGFYDGKSGFLRIHSKDKDQGLTVDAEYSQSQQGKIKSRVPIDFLNKFFKVSEKNVAGLCKSTITIDGTKDGAMSGDFSIDDACCDNLKLGTVKSHFKKIKNHWHGAMLFDHETIGAMEGEWRWDTAKKLGFLELSNSSTLQSPLTYWKVGQHDFSIHCNLGPNVVNGSYQLIATHEILNTPMLTKGNFSFDDDKMVADGSFNDDSYELEVLTSPHFFLNKIVYFDKDKKNLASISSSKSDEIKARINFECLQRVLHDLYDYETSGEGEILINASLKDYLLSGTVLMENAHIKIPETYNFLQQVQGLITVDCTKKRINIDNLNLELHKGSITSQRMTICWDEINKTVFVHVPLLFCHVFLNFEKDLFTEFSGNILLLKQGLDSLHVKGSIGIDQGQCKKNIFSSALQKNLIFLVATPFGQNDTITCDLSLKTKKPIAIQTSFLQTNASLELFLKENLLNPVVTGKITLSSGLLGFANRPLYITRGRVYFMPNQLDDPAIELIAKGKIKKYHIVLRATGSLQHPHISLESSPPLTEEQIITLLLAGTQEGSVALIMPSLIMQNLETLLFGPEQTHSKLENYVKNLLGPLKHIRFVPTFFDQTARGGFRGSIEIDVSDRLHALIQKNFSLTEDTLIEFEYLLSDDVTIRGIKDQRGDVGGEVEMRWKF